MDMYTHTIIATACIAGAFYAGLYFNKRSIMNSIVTSMLDTLEKLHKKNNPIINP